MLKFLKMPIYQRPRILPVFIWLIFAAVAVIATWVGLVELSAEIRSYRWETTQGEVLKTESHRVARNVQYSYNVDGNHYSASRNFMVVPLQQIPAAGDIVTVYYDPYSLSDSLLSKGIRIYWGILLILSSLMIIAILIGAVFMKRKGAWKQTQVPGTIT